MHAKPDRNSDSPDHLLTHVIDELAPLLPAQGPISIFIHHNTLHAFEQLPFEDAVERAAAQLGREPFLSEARYREKLASGRILATDVDAVLREHLGSSASADVADVSSRLELWRAVALYGIPAATGHELSWILEETPALARFRTDLPAQARSALASLRGGNGHATTDERQGVQRLWDACVRAAGRSAPPPPAAGKAPVRHRDYIHATYGLDTDAWIHPSLIRFLASYLDQGLAHWTMPNRALGIHGCFLEIYRSRVAAQCGTWARTLPRVVLDDHAADRDALTSIEHSLAVLGV